MGTPTWASQAKSGAGDASNTVVAEITELKSNVLFEVGYALAAEKQIVLLGRGSPPPAAVVKVA